ncbi:hypothetical protein H8356DRAFT_1430835 [Neocallimastix lanati (nom. inval.)]|nr:hypothetical protein H8356DRAFT_1430835 [Neocallimastix sp. JGI-2020a]
MIISYNYIIKVFFKYNSSNKVLDIVADFVDFHKSKITFVKDQNFTINGNVCKVISIVGGIHLLDVFLSYLG